MLTTTWLRLKMADGELSSVYMAALESCQGQNVYVFPEIDCALKISCKAIVLFGEKLDFFMAIPIYNITLVFYMHSESPCKT